MDKRCDRCAYYCAKRSISRGFLGSSIKADKNQALCSKSNKEVWGSGRCYDFTPCAEYHKLLGEEENERIKKENEKVIKATNEENNRIEREVERAHRSQLAELRAEKEAIRAEREALEKEREALKYQQWYGTLSKKEREAEDARIAKEEEEERERIYQEEMQKARQERINEEKRRRDEENYRIFTKKKRTLYIIGFVLLFVGLIVCYAGFSSETMVGVIMAIIFSFVVQAGVILVIVAFFLKNKS